MVLTREGSVSREQLVASIAELGPRFRERAFRYDREASFPFENYDDLRERGFLKLCIPTAYGGLGASFADYMRVAEELGRHCGATALTFNMHTMTMLWTGIVADLVEMPADVRAEHERRRRAVYARVVKDGRLHSQPISEVTPDAHLNPETTAQPVDGGFVVSGRKIFASLSGAADAYDVTCVVKGETVVRFLSVPADADGVSVEGEWDTVGMRGTVSRTVVIRSAFVPAENELLPTGYFGLIQRRYPYPSISLTGTYLGVCRAILDFTRDYLRGEVPGGPTVPRRDSAVKQFGWARMQILYQQARALVHSCVDDDALDPSREQLARMWAAVYTAMENAAEVASLGVRVCGGRAIFRHFPLERLYRDARLGSLMLPFTSDICLERLGREFLFDSDGQTGAGSGR